MYKKVMVPLDGSALAECVLPHVDAFVRAGLIANVTFVRVVEPVRIPAEPEAGITDKMWQQAYAERMAEARNYLNKLVNRLKYNQVNIKSELLMGTAADSLADYAAKSGVDLIIIATHGRSGIGRWVWGSVADRVLRSAKAAVLIVRAPGSASGV